MSSRTCLSIILAAGEGTRMQSALPKTLHKIASYPLIGHVVQTLQAAGCDQLAVIVGKGGELLFDALQSYPDILFFEQQERLGTAHAVLAARSILQKPFDDVLIAFGDTPLLEKETVIKLREALAQGADIALTGFYTDHPEGYGRLIEHGGKIKAIIEEKDANSAQKTIRFCNGGLMAIRGEHILSLLDKIDNNNVQGEYYLTDLVAHAVKDGLIIEAISVSAEQLQGVNTRLELAQAETLWQQRKRREMMRSGVTLVAEETVFFSYDTIIAPDVTIEPYVVFGPDVRIASGVRIYSFSHIEGAVIGEKSQIGPYARLRPGVNLQAGVKIGNFCEIKKATIDCGTKINHLTYIGDARIGARANIGAGTITCNYDGHNKLQTVIGDDAFIGSNSALVAPVSIGDRSYIASGSVITHNVSADALAFGRARQVEKPGRATLLRSLFSAVKLGSLSKKSSQ